MHKSRPPEERAATPQKRGRGRPRAFDRDAALDEAVRLFWRKGFEATSIADLTAAMGIGAPSLYAAFGSKEALYTEALRHYECRYGDAAWRRFDAARTVRSAVEGLLMDSAEALTSGRSGASKGCMLVMSSIDRSEHPALCEAVRASRHAALDRLEARFARAMEAGEIPRGAKLRELARYVQTVQSGMSILARDGASRLELEAVAKMAMASWDATALPMPVRTSRGSRAP